MDAAAATPTTPENAIPGAYVVPGKAGFLPGNPGRKPGTRNSLTNSVKTALELAFNALQADPDHNLTAWAKREPTEFYKIAARLIPQEITGSLTVSHELDGMERIGRVAAILATRGVGGTGRIVADVPMAAIAGPTNGSVQQPG